MKGNDRAARMCQLLIAALLATNQGACASVKVRWPSVKFVTAHLTDDTGTCVVKSSNVEPAKLKLVQTGDMIVWVVKSDCAGTHVAIIRPKGTAFLDQSCEGKTIPLDKTNYTFVGCVVTGGHDTFPYEILVDGSTYSAQGELDVQVWP